MFFPIPNKTVQELLLAIFNINNQIISNFHAKWNKLTPQPQQDDDIMPKKHCPTTTSSPPALKLTHWPLGGITAMILNHDDAA